MFWVFQTISSAEAAKETNQVRVPSAGEYCKCTSSDYKWVIDYSCSHSTSTWRAQRGQPIRPTLPLFNCTTKLNSPFDFQHVLSFQWASLSWPDCILLAMLATLPLLVHIFGIHFCQRPTLFSDCMQCRPLLQHFITAETQLVAGKYSLPCA